MLLSRSSLMRVLPLIFCFFILSLTASAQSVIKGKVTDADGVPLESVSVRIKGSAMGTATKADGTFSLSVTAKPKDILLFSFVGFTDKEVVLGDNKEVNVKLEKSDQSLNAV